MELVRCKDLVHTWKRGSGIKIKEFTLRKGEIIVVEGESGSGKSVFFHLLFGFFPSSGGERFWKGKKIRTREEEERMQRCLGILFQEGEPLDFLTVRENLLLAGIGKEEIPPLLRRVRLSPEILEKYPAELSIGMKRRVSLLMALGKKKDIYVLDEPLAGLDPQTRKEIMKITAEILRDKTAIVITHEREFTGFLERKLGARIVKIEEVIEEVGEKRVHPGKTFLNFVEEAGKFPFFFFPLRSPLPHFLDFLFITLPFIILFSLLISFSYTLLLSGVCLYSFESKISRFFSLVSVRGLSPVFTAIIASSRIVPKLTSTTAVMSLKRQFFLLKTLGKSPERYILSPAFISLILSIPVLTWCMFYRLGKGGGFFAGKFFSWCTPLYFWNKYFTTPSFFDILVMLVKGAVYGGLMGIVSYYMGKKARVSVSEVGVLTSLSLLLFLFMVFLIDLIFNLLPEWR